MKIRYFSIISFILLISFRFNIFGQDTTNSQLFFEIPVIDFGYQSLAMQTSANHRNNVGANTNSPTNFTDFINSYGNPSMVQSLEWTTSTASLLGYGINKGVNTMLKPDTRFKKIANTSLKEVAFLGSNFFLAFYPLSFAWLHEEFHRSILTTSNVYSFNELNGFDALGESNLSVINITDEDLAYFKTNDPAGFNRMLAAGIEGELLYFRKLALNNFYYKSNMPIYLLNFFVKFNTISSIRG